MAAIWTITQLSRNAKIPQATLRYWERLGLLPRAARSHTGYRLFPPEALDYVGFVRKSKAMGLSLQQMKRVLELARGGRNPCPEVEQWVLGRLGELREQIRSLQLLERRLRALSRGLGNGRHDRDRSNEICSLIVGLPEEKRVRERNRDTTICADNECERTDAACHRRQTK